MSLYRRPDLPLDEFANETLHGLPVRDGSLEEFSLGFERKVQSDRHGSLYLFGHGSSERTRDLDHVRIASQMTGVRRGDHNVYPSAFFHPRELQPSMGPIQAETCPGLSRQATVRIQCFWRRRGSAFATRLGPEFGSGLDRLLEKRNVGQLSDQLIQTLEPLLFPSASTRAGPQNPRSPEYRHGSPAFSSPWNQSLQILASSPPAGWGTNPSGPASRRITSDHRHSRGRACDRRADPRRVPASGKPGFRAVPAHPSGRHQPSIGRRRA